MHQMNEVDVIQALRILRKLNAEMPIQMVIVLLIIARFGPCRMASLRPMAELSQASISRNIAALGKIHRKGMPGLGLVDTEEDFWNRRHKIVFLTPKGREYVQLLLNPEAAAKFLNTRR